MDKKPVAKRKILGLINVGIKKIRKEEQETHHPLSITSTSNKRKLLIDAGQNQQLSDRRPLPPPPKHNVMYHPSRYKTELCRQFEELGFCDYGDRCLFAHGSYQLKGTAHRHPKFKTEMCAAFLKDGYCSFGSRCSFVHPKANPDELIHMMTRKTKECNWPPETKAGDGERNAGNKNGNSYATKGGFGNALDLDGKRVFDEYNFHIYNLEAPISFIERYPHHRLPTFSQIYSN